MVRRAFFSDLSAINGKVNIHGKGNILCLLRFVPVALTNSSCSRENSPQSFASAKKVYPAPILDAWISALILGFYGQRRASPWGAIIVCMQSIEITSFLCASVPLRPAPPCPWVERCGCLETSALLWAGLVSLPKRPDRKNVIFWPVYADLGPIDLFQRSAKGKAPPPHGEMIRRCGTSGTALSGACSTAGRTTEDRSTPGVLSGNPGITFLGRPPSLRQRPLTPP